MAQTPKSWAMLHCKCPRCRRGDMFTGGAYNFGRNKILDRCPHCDLRYEIEPGYFYAAMYVSYAFNVGEGLTLGLGTYFLTHNTTSPWLYIGAILGGVNEGKVESMPTCATILKGVLEVLPPAILSMPFFLD